jgi:hypothetical protein
LYTDGEDRVFLSMPSPDKLLRPTKSGTFTLYACATSSATSRCTGCEEPPWIRPRRRRGGALCRIGSRGRGVRGARREAVGAGPADYHADGNAVERQLKEKAVSDTAAPARKWGAIVSDTGFREVLRYRRGCVASPAQRVCPECGRTGEATRKWWSAAAAVLFKRVEASGFKGGTTARSWSGGRSSWSRRRHRRGKKSIADGRHARRFNARRRRRLVPDRRPSTARYGAHSRRRRRRSTALCDAGMKPIATWKQPTGRSSGESSGSA